jgi:hypothetical protein
MATIFFLLQQIRRSNNIPDYYVFYILFYQNCHWYLWIVFDVYINHGPSCLKILSWTCFVKISYIIAILIIKIPMSSYFKPLTIKFIDKFVLYFLFGERFHDKTTLNWLNPFQEDDHDFDVVGSGSINGFFIN